MLEVYVFSAGFEVELPATIVIIVKNSINIETVQKNNCTSGLYNNLITIFMILDQYAINNLVKNNLFIYFLLFDQVHE